MKLSQALNSGREIPRDELAGLTLHRYGFAGNLDDPRALAEWLKQNPQCDVEVREIAVPLAQKKNRPEQEQFRQAVRRAYDGKCAITEESAEPALEAAHLRGRSHERGHNRARDGILLRADLHNLYDRGWMTIDKNGTVRFCTQAGPNYTRWNGQKIRMPKRNYDRPML